MGVDLISSKEGKYYSANWTTWRYFLDLACDHGWVPARTVYNRRNDPCYWLSSYTDADPASKERLDEHFSKSEKEWNGSYCVNAYQFVTDEDAANIRSALEKAMNDDSTPVQDREFIREFTAFLANGAFQIG